ncbi:MAG TPA: histidine kinase [Ktedonobacterales bacterium]|nr:histidine kinase [Ktedonobacterales bacterium]
MELASAPEKSEGSKGATSSRAGRSSTSEGVIASSGIAFKLWRLYQHFWLMCLLFPLVSLVRTPGSPARVGLGLGALVFFAVSYTWLMWSHPVSRTAQSRKRFRTQVGLFVVLVVLVLVLSATYDLAFLWLFIGVSACAGILFPLIGAFVVVSVLMFMPILISLLVRGDFERVDWPLTIALLLLVRGLGLDMMGLARMGQAIRELYTARRELARLAVAEERLRVARDLHDLLGHTLSMIALKSELARRLVEQDPGRAVQEITEVESVARQTLREVREAVAGYRQPTLQSELEGAQQLLEAAGIEYQLDLTVGTLPPTIDAVLAWVVREGVTNIVRHSHARRCHIQVRQVTAGAQIEITNDDRKSAPLETKRQVPPLGSGLSGIVERVAALGGQCEAGPCHTDEMNGFRLHVTLPIPLPEQGKHTVLIKADLPAAEEATS